MYPSNFLFVTAALQGATKATCWRGLPLPDVSLSLNDWTLYDSNPLAHNPHPAFPACGGPH